MMDGNKRNFFKKRPNIQFKRKGGNNNYKKGKWNESGREQPLEDYQSLDTVYRILCPSKKIGGVIGKGGNIVKALREETRAKISVSDSVLGSDERVIIIYSSPTKISSKQNNNEDSDEGNEMEPHCAAQNALLKVHARIVEEDLFGGVTFDDDNENSVVTTRLLVPNNTVGCVLGKRGDVIQRLRSETGASIRVLPADQLPTCAKETDELVQISGKPNVTKRALYEVSTLLHQNPRKDKPPSGFPMPIGGQGFHPPGAPMTNALSPRNPVLSNRAPSHTMPPMPWTGGYENRSSGFARGGFNGVSPEHGGEALALAEFSMKILCSTGKIGGVIGKGGFNVKQLQLETGATIHVQDASTDSEERVIHVSAFEALWKPRSQTIEAILELQNITSEFSDKGIIATRLLVPSSKVGCLLGQGGQVINEMRRRTQADIRVYSKDDRPACAAEDEELVQISGNLGTTKDALAEITSRLRVRTLRDTNAGAEPAPVGPKHRFGPAGHLPGGGPLPTPSAVGAGSSGGYDPLKFVLGNGERLRFWEDGWLEGGLLKDIFPRLFMLSTTKNLSISRLTVPSLQSVSWNFDFRRNLRESEIEEVAGLLQKVEAVRLCLSRADRRRWSLEGSGQFTCKSYFSFLRNNDSVQQFLPSPQIWNAKVPPKVKVLVWLVALRKVNTCDQIQRRMPYTCFSPHWCVLCKSGEESVNHVFLHCPYSIQLWWNLLKEVGAVWVIPKGCFELLSTKFDALGKGRKAKTLWGSLLMALFWNIWMERNKRVFEDYIGVEVEELWDKTKHWAALWSSVAAEFRDYNPLSIARDLVAAVF